MTKNTYIFFAIVAVVVIGFIFLKGDRPADTTEKEMKAPSESVIVSLKEQNTSGQSGVATLLSSSEGKVTVKIELTGSPAGIEEPAHIHVGACPNPGDVKYPLAVVMNGKSETILDVSMKDLLALRPLAINVHKSKEDLKTYIACGDILADPSFMEKKEGAMKETEGAMMENTEGGVME